MVLFLALENGLYFYVDCEGRKRQFPSHSVAVCPVQVMVLPALVCGRVCCAVLFMCAFVQAVIRFLLNPI